MIKPATDQPLLTPIPHQDPSTHDTNTNPRATSTTFPSIITLADLLLYSRDLSQDSSAMTLDTSTIESDSSDSPWTILGNETTMHDLKEDAYSSLRFHHYRDALYQLNCLLELKINQLGPNHPEVIKIREKIAISYHCIGQYQESLTLHLDILLTKTKNKHDNLSIAKTHADLLLLFIDMGHEGLAKSHYEKALNLIQSFPNSFDKRIGELYHAFSTYLATSNPTLAKSYLRKALPEIISSKRVQTAYFSNSAFVYLQLKDFELALEYAERALRIRRKYYTENSIRIASSLEKLIAIHLASDNKAEAKKNLNEAINIIFAALYDFAPEPVAICSRLAEHCRNLDLHQKAKALHQVSLWIDNKSYTRDERITQLKFLIRNLGQTLSID